MINPHTKTGEDLAHVAEHLAAWPSDTDFVHVQSGVIHMIEGGISLAVSYISREQWAAAKSLHQYWFPEEQPKPEGYCDVCGDTHCIHELYPGICAEYDGGMVSLDLSKSIYNGDYEPSKQASLEELSKQAQIDLCTQLGVFTSPEEDEAWREAEKKFNPVWQSPHDAGGVCVFHGCRYSAHEQCYMCVLAGEAAKEEAKQPAYDPEDVAGVHSEGKQARYQDSAGEDWIDEAARTFTAEEFRGAMRFTIGKYNRRMGKNDDLIKEIEKMRDYCQRWIDVEKGR